jgi:hypothetical protein
LRKFEVEVVRTDRYVVEIDENIINEDWMKQYRDDFCSIYDLRGHAENIALSRSRHMDSFIEGYGVPLIDGQIPYGVDDEDVQHGINIKIVDEDEDYEVDASVIK